MPIGGLGGAGGGGDYPWNHNYTTADQMISCRVARPFVKAINERLKAIGKIQLSLDMAGTLALANAYQYPSYQHLVGLNQWAPEVRMPVETGVVVAPLEVDGTVWTDAFQSEVSPGVFVNHKFAIGEVGWTPAIGDPVIVRGATLGEIGATGLYGTAFSADYPGYPLCSYKALQSLIYNLAALYYTDDTSDRSGDAYVSSDLFPFRKTLAMPIVTDGFGNQQFDYANWPPPDGFIRWREPVTSATSFTFGYATGDRARFLVNHGSFPSIPITPLGEESAYGGKIVKLIGGVWVIDPDQSSPLILSDQLSGIWQEGDIVTPDNLKQMADAIDSLIAIYYTPNWVGKSRGTGNSNWPTAFTFPDATSTAEAAWAALAESASTPGLAPKSDYRAFETGGTGVWRANLSTAKAIISDEGFQHGLVDIWGGGGYDPRGLVHTYASEIDLYMVANDNLTTGEESNRAGYNIQFEPPVAGMVRNQWFKIHTLPSSADDARSYDGVGSNTVTPTRPSSASGYIANLRGFGRVATAAVRKFNIEGGFEFV